MKTTASALPSIPRNLDATMSLFSVPRYHRKSSMVSYYISPVCTSGDTGVYAGHVIRCVFYDLISATLTGAVNRLLYRLLRIHSLISNLRWDTWLVMNGHGCNSQLFFFFFFLAREEISVNKPIYTRIHRFCRMGYMSIFCLSSIPRQKHPNQTRRPVIADHPSLTIYPTARPTDLSYP